MLGRVIKVWVDTSSFSPTEVPLTKPRSANSSCTGGKAKLSFVLVTRRLDMLNNLRQLSGGQFKEALALGSLVMVLAGRSRSWGTGKSSAEH